ncbi:outer membrane beta-barrel protein [Flavobacteriaceae bacterium M23B6Z8]
MKTLRFFMLIALMMTTFESALGQEKWSVEIRPKLDFPTEDLGGIDLKTGFGFELAVNYNFMEHLGAYVGWGYNTFNADDSFFAEVGDTDFDETGYTFGLQFIHPIGSSENLSYLIRAGGIYNHIEFENDAGDITADSDHGLGWEVGAGLQIELGNHWSLRPQISYRALSRDLEIGSETIDINLNYISFGVGIVKSF